MVPLLKEMDCAQLHQSADISNSTPIYRNIAQPAGETCWTNTDSTNSWQCPSTYKTHSGGTAGTPCGAYSGAYGGVSGTVNEYICEEWSYAGQTSLAAWSAATKVFYVVN